MQVVLCNFFLIFLNLASAANFNNNPLRTEFEWKYFDYDWDSPSQKDWFVRSGLYDFRNLTPIDVDRSPDGRTFVTIIRQPGVPASLHIVTNNIGDSGPLLYPYPDWSWYSNNYDCEGIISVYRVAIDYCNRMWVLDTGRVGFNNRVCPAKLLLFDLYTDRLIQRFEIPRSISENPNGRSLLVTPIVEAYGQFCEHTSLYIADVTGFGLITWDHRFGFHRLEAEEFKGNLTKGNYTIAGESFVLPDGILGMAISPIRYRGEERILAFKPLSSRSIYAAHTEVLKRSRAGDTIRYYRAEDVLPSQASAMAFTSRGTLLYGLTGEVGVGCWHVDSPWTSDAFEVAMTDVERLQFVSGMKVIGRDPRQEHLIMMSNRLQKAFSGTMDFSEVNFRVTIAPVNQVIDGTGCNGGLNNARIEDNLPKI